MKKINQLILPIAGLAIWLGIMVLLASAGYYVQHTHSEWLELTEHWIDQRKEAVEDLQEYLDTREEDEYTDLRQTIQTVVLHNRAVDEMKDPEVPIRQALARLVDDVGYESREASWLIWEARTLRPFLNIEQDFRLWDKAVAHWSELESLTDRVRASVIDPNVSGQTLEELDKRIQNFRQVSNQYDFAIQDQVESASRDLMFWSNLITVTLALVLFIAGALIIAMLYQNARRSQKKFRTLFESSPDGIAIADASGHIQQVNESFRDLFGYTQEEAVGQNVDRLLTQTRSEQNEAEQITDRLSQNEVYQGEVTRYHKNGEPVEAMLSTVPVTLRDNVDGYYAIYIDIREQKQLERKNRELLERERTLRAQAEQSREQFKTMFEKSPTAIALIECPNFKYTYTNEIHRQLTGKDTVGSTVEEAFPEFNQQGIIDLLQHVYETGETYEGHEESIEIEVDGEKQTYYRDFIYTPIKSKNGQTYSIFIESVDVTDKVIYRQQLQEELEEKTTLLQEIHHRVKNNLASITGILQLQLHHIKNKQAREALIDSELRIHTLADIHELLYESDKLSEIQMDKYIHKLTRHIQNVSEVPEEISTEVDIEPFSLAIDQAQPLALMLNELIQNAYNHAFPDSRSGKLSVIGEQKKGKVHIIVRDDGIGIPDGGNQQEGLGMELIKSIQTQLEADVQVHNDEGTRYEIIFEKSQIK